MSDSPQRFVGVHFYLRDRLLLIGCSSCPTLIELQGTLTFELFSTKSGEITRVACESCVEKEGAAILDTLEKAK